MMLKILVLIGMKHTGTRDRPSARVGPRLRHVCLLLLTLTKVVYYHLLSKILRPIELASCLRRMFICKRKRAMFSIARQLR